MAGKADSSQATSDDLRTQIEEQTSELAEEETVEEAAPEEETETEEGETEAEEEATEETSEEETTEKPKAKAKETKPLHRIKVEGKEEELPYEKLIEYAQKGRHYEKEMSKLRQEKERLKEVKEPKPFAPGADIDKINEQFVAELQKDPFGTLVKFYGMAKTQDAETTKQERIADKQFELEMKDEVPHWGEIKPMYQEFRDLGYDREQAFLKAENDYMKGLLVNAISKGRKEGLDKAKMKAKAVLPVKEKLSKTRGLPSMEELKKMSSGDIAKHLRRVKNEGW